MLSSDWLGRLDPLNVQLIRIQDPSLLDLGNGGGVRREAGEMETSSLLEDQGTT